MKCEQVQELLMTDYHDNFIASELKKQVDEHLRECSNCRTFYEEFLQFAVEPVRQMSLDEPPVELWQNIRSQIEMDVSREEESAKISSNTSVLRFWKPAVAAGVLIAASILLFIVNQNNVPQKGVSDYIAEQAMYLADSDSSSYIDDQIEFSSVIEQVFM